MEDATPQAQVRFPDNRRQSEKMVKEGVGGGGGGGGKREEKGEQIEGGGA
jgi:hypothetical protein